MATVVQRKERLIENVTSTTITFDNDFTPGNAIIVALVWFHHTPNATSTLKTISDNKSHTFTKRFGGHRDPTNDWSYTGDMWVEIHDCLNAADASPSTHIVITLTGESADYNKCLAVAMEVSGLDAFDKVSTQSDGAYNDSSVTADLPTRTTADQFAVAVMGSWAENIMTPSGWSAFVVDEAADDVPNGSVLYRNLSTEASLSAVWSYTTSVYGAAAAIASYTLASSGASLRMAFDLDSAKFTSADNNIEGYVWIDGFPDQKLAIFFDGLAGDATAGKLYIPDSHAKWPSGLADGTSLKGVFYNSSDGSMLMNGVVEEA